MRELLMPQLPIVGCVSDSVTHLSHLLTVFLFTEITLELPMPQACPDEGRI